MPILENNTRVGRFVVQNLIKSNLYTETYRAVDEDNNPYFLKLFVISRLPARLINQRTYTVKEIEYCKLLSHRNLISFVDSGKLDHSEGKCQYYITNYFSGAVLADYIAQRGVLTEEQALKIFKGVLQGLNFLHKLSPAMCHNDLDPSNIVIGDADGEPKLIDFGHLSERCSGLVSFDTADIDILYHANESMVNIFDEQSDIFSACAVLYFMLTGKAPWVMELDSEKTYRDRFKELVAYRKANPLNLDELQISTATKYILAEGLKLQYSDRISSVDALLTLLEAPEKIEEKIEEEQRAERERPRPEGGGRDESRRRSREDNDDPNDINRFVLDVRRGEGEGFKDIAGMKELKEFLERKVIFVIRNEEVAREYNLTPPNGMLLYGPPGCGKTFFAEKFAEETGFNFALIKASDIASSYVHGTQDKIGRLFKQAEKHRPIVLCFDEFDALVPDRSSQGATHTSSEVNEFLSQMNNCSKRGIFIVATSNRPDKIDPAVLRTGRIDRMVYVPLPDMEARLEMFKMYVNNRPALEDINYEELARCTEGYIASDIAYIVNDAAMTAAFSRTKISHELLMTTIKNVPPSLRAESISVYDDIRRRMDTSNRKNVTTRRPIGYSTHLEDK